MSLSDWTRMFAPVPEGEDDNGHTPSFIEHIVDTRVHRIVEALQDIEDAVDNLSETAERRRLVNSIQSTTDTDQVILKIPPSNGAWEIERIATVVTGAGGTVAIAFYLDAVNPTGLLHIVSDSAMFSSEVTNIYVPKGTNEIVAALSRD
jgi:citrate lyase beta subunit